MKILLLSTFDTSGGAALACQRLLQAFRQNPEATVQMLVQQHKSDSSPSIQGIAQGFISKKMAFLRFSLERLYFLFYEKNKKVRFAFSPANTGIDISKHPLVREADILHLHWINFGFLSLSTLDKLFQLGKPIVWTLHDMWVFTGGCHYAGTCQNYQTQCHNCAFLKKPKEQDLSYRIFQKKQRIFQKKPDLHIVTCSQWLANMAQNSTLLQPFSIQNIPNPINHHLFKPSPKQELQKKLHLPTDKFLLLFGAMNTQDSRKGFIYLKEALDIFTKKNPDLQKNTEIVLFGKAQQEILQDMPLKVHNLGVLSQDSVIQAYNATHLFLLPSLEDNLPNTVMEAMACGTPVVAFKVGGIPEMVEHKKNGYLATYKSSKDLAQGIHWVVSHENYTLLSENARNKVISDFTEENIAQQYISLYQNIL